MRRSDRGVTRPDVMFLSSVVLLIVGIGILFRAGPLGRRLSFILGVLVVVMLVLRLTVRRRNS